MQQMKWLGALPEGTLEGGIELANKLAWNVKVVEKDGRWEVFGGDQIMLVADSRECVDAFLYGLTLAYAVLPEHIFELLSEAISKWSD
jgi:hypothetical protein